MNMKNAHTKIDNHGRLLIPYSIRNQLKYKKGDSFVIRIIDNELRIISLKATLAAIQELVKKSIPAGISLVDELISERRAAAKTEDNKF